LEENISVKINIKFWRFKSFFFAYRTMKFAFLLVSDLIFSSAPPAKSSWVATSPPYWGSHSPDYAIDGDYGNPSIYHSLTDTPLDWLQIDIGEHRVVKGLTVQNRGSSMEIRASNIEFRIGVTPVGHTNLQVME
jgi:hypothetical protein